MLYFLAMPYNYSVIVPFRDRLELLHKAIASVPDREDVEIIVVDNSETPHGAEKMPNLLKAHLVYLTSDPTKGAGCARNVGLEQVEGKFVVFLDADDYFTREAFSAFDRYLEQDYDIVYFDADSIKLSDGSRSTRHETIHRYISIYCKYNYDGNLRYHFSNPICKMFKADYLKKGGFRFQEVKVSNDLMFSLITGHNAKKITADPAVVYMITESGEGQSLVKSKTAINQYTRFTVLVDANAFLKSIGQSKLCYKLSSATWYALFHFGPVWFIKYLKYAHSKGLRVFRKK